ncbi:unnamed protein product [Sphenostylis stenocarpa]|uniref:Uncharacterized protein n=1 Tax=Sphenostylis stenocarpa TaxID=92480 RepID=A0AA86VYU9_9FABA|nr:unnamed protein product [Sphenostylis stenocarpa]
MVATLGFKEAIERAFIVKPSGVAQTCDRLGKILGDAGGVLTSKAAGRHYSILSWVKSCVDWQIQTRVSVETSRQIERFLRGGGVNLGKLGLWFGLKTFKS